MMLRKNDLLLVSLHTAIRITLAVTASIACHRIASLDPAICVFIGALVSWQRTQRFMMYLGVTAGITIISRRR